MLLLNVPGKQVSTAVNCSSQLSATTNFGDQPGFQSFIVFNASVIILLQDELRNKLVINIRLNINCV